MTTFTTSDNEAVSNLPARLNTDDDAFWRAQILLEPGDDMAGPDQYPRLFNLSAGLYYPAVLRATDPAPPEYVTLPQSSLMCNGEARALDIAVAQNTRSPSRTGSHRGSSRLKRSLGPSRRARLRKRCTEPILHCRPPLRAGYSLVLRKTRRTMSKKATPAEACAAAPVP